MSKKKTSDVLRELDRDFNRKLHEEHEAYRSNRAFMEKLCNAGLVDDVEPDGPAPTDTMEITCGHCGKLLKGLVYSRRDFLEEHRKTCAAQ